MSKLDSLQAPGGNLGGLGGAVAAATAAGQGHPEVLTEPPQPSRLAPQQEGTRCRERLMAAVGRSSRMPLRAAAGGEEERAPRGREAPQSRGVGAPLPPPAAGHRATPGG